MQFNGETNNLDLCTLADDKVNTNDNSFTLEEKTRAANQALRLIWGWIHETGGWRFDDGNQTDLPSATSNLVANQSFYALPTDSAHLEGVSFKGEGSSSWTKLRPITLQEIQQGQAEPEFFRTSSTPVYFSPLADGIKIYPASSYSQDDSLQIEYSRDMVEFVPTSTTQKPGFEPQFHEAVATYMSLHYANSRQLKSREEIRREWSNENRNFPLGYEQKIKRYYQQKIAEKFPPRIQPINQTSDFI